MSVAAGTAQPCIATASPRLIQAKIAAGTATPASAHATGSATCDSEDNCPDSASRLSSSATSRKKIAIRPSLIHSKSGLAIFSPPTCTATGSSRKPS